MNRASINLYGSSPAIKPARVRTMHCDYLPPHALSAKHYYCFDEFNTRLAELTCATLLFDYDLCSHQNINEAHYYFHQVQRPQVRYTAISLKHDASLISRDYKPLNINLSLVIMAIDDKKLCFNGVWMSTSQIALICARSRVPFTLKIPANTRVLIAEIDHMGKQLLEFSNALTPLEVNLDHMGKLRKAADITDRGELTKHTRGGTHALLTLTAELQDQIPPRRPQSLKGRSRLPRKVFMPKVMKLMEENNIALFTLNHAAESLNISTKTINLLFKYYTGFAPKRYYLLTKLFAFRHELQKPTTQSVIHAASNMNINGWSRYATRYQRVFGEMPHKTYQVSHH